jgi:hypothetical protein
MHKIYELSLPAALKATLIPLARPIQGHYLPYFRQELESFQEEIRTRADYNEFLDVKLYESIYRAARHLLDVYPNRSGQDQSLILAALRYLIIDEEEDADLEHPYPFDTDALVLNAVLQQLGMEEWIIPV